MAIFDKLFKKNKNDGEKAIHVKRANNIHDAIPYNKVFFDGTIETKPGTFTRAYALGDLNFKQNTDERQKDIFGAYEDFLNSFGNNMNFQLLIRNTSSDKRKTFEQVKIGLKRDNLNEYRQEINKMLLEKVQKGGRSLSQEKTLIVSIKSENIEKAVIELNNAEKRIIRSVSRFDKDFNIYRITIAERLKTIFDIYNQQGEGVFYNDFEKDGKTPRFNFDALGRLGITSKDVVGPSAMEFNANDFTIGNTRGATFYLEKVPNWLSTDFISDLADAPCPLSISINHRPIRKGEGLKMIKNQIYAVNAQITEKQKKAIQDGYSYELISPDLVLSQKQSNELLGDVVDRDQKLFFITFIITIFAEDDDRLKEYTEYIESIAENYMCSIKKLIFQQEQGFNSSLPLALNEVMVQRLYTTESASVYIPFSTMEMYQKNGIYYGLNKASNNMIVYDRLTGSNYNGISFGMPGKGKSFGCKVEMTSAFLKSNKNVVYVLDPESEYGKIAKAFGGEVIDLSSGSQTFVNPLDMDLDYDGENNPITLKQDYIISLIEIMLGADRQLDPVARSIVNRCVKNIYMPYLRHIDTQREKGRNITIDKDAMPTLSNLYHELRAQPEPEAETIANILESYTVGGYTNFARKSNIETNNRFVVYDIRNLGSGMQSLGLYICLNDIWNKMIENKKKGLYTWIYIDEFYKLLQTDSSTKFLVEIWKRARKWNGVPTAIMQNTEDLLKTSEARNILNNSSFIKMYSLSSMDKTNIAEFLELPDSVVEDLSTGKSGEGVIYNGKTALQFQDNFPKNTKLYNLFNTQNKNFL